MGVEVHNSGGASGFGGVMNANVVLECSATSKRFAEAQTVAELNREWDSTQKRFEQNWDRRGHRLLVIIHDEDGFIGDRDVTQALVALNSFGKREPVDVLLHTHGGEVGATMQIAEVLVHRPRTATFIPIFAHSGGTMIALSTSTIHLGKGAALGPVDIQFRGRPARDIVQIADELGDHAPPALRADAREARRMLADWSQKVCKATNRRHKGFAGWRGCELAGLLTNGSLSHSQSISYAMARRLHMHVSRKVPKSAYALLSARLEMLRRLRELQEQVLIEKVGPAPV